MNVIAMMDDCSMLDNVVYDLGNDVMMEIVTREMEIVKREMEIVKEMEIVTREMELVKEMEIVTREMEIVTREMEMEIVMDDCSMLDNIVYDLDNDVMMEMLLFLS